MNTSQIEQYVTWALCLVIFLLTALLYTELRHIRRAVERMTRNLSAYRDALD